MATSTKIRHAKPNCADMDSDAVFERCDGSKPCAQPELEP